MKTLALALMLMLTWTIPSAAQDDIQMLKAQVEAEKQRILLLEQRIQRLEDEQAKAATGAAISPTKSTNVSVGNIPVVAPDLDTNSESPVANKARLELYGSVELDAIEDFNSVDPNWNATLRPSKIPVNCPGDAGCGKAGANIASMRGSVFGVRGYLPTGMGMLRTRFDFDLFGVGNNAGATTMRIEHLYGELGHFLIGQTETLLMDSNVYPIDINFWGPNGMIFVRQPQFRWTSSRSHGTQFATAIEVPSAAIDPGNAPSFDPLLAGVVAHLRYPDITAQIKSDQSWGHLQFAGVQKWIGYDTPTGPGGNPSGGKFGYGVSLSGSMKTLHKDKLMGQVSYGQGISGYINDCCVDLAPNSSLKATAVPLLGWLAFYDHFWNDRWSSTIGYSEARQDNTGGQLNDAFHIGRYAMANLLWRPVKNVMTGGEVLWGERENKNGASGEDIRTQYSIQYKF